MYSVIWLGINNPNSKQWVCECAHSAVVTTPEVKTLCPGLCDLSQTHNWTYKSQIFDDQGISSEDIFLFCTKAEPVMNLIWF